MRAGISDAVAALSRYVALGRIGIAVHLSEIVARETGLGGYAYGADSCAIYVDPRCEALRSGARTNAAAIAVHELHHVLRMQHTAWPRFDEVCAGEVLVLEELATHCEVFLGYPEPQTVQEVQTPLTRECLETIAPIVGDPNAGWRWIYGLNGFPERVYKAIYPMGHAVVGAYLAQTGRTPIEALHTPWRDVWRCARAHDGQPSTDNSRARNVLP